MPVPPGTPVPLVLLPGMSCSPRLWDGVVQEMAAARPARHARPVVVPEVDRATMDDQVDSLLDHLPPRFALGGLSLGAIVAMAVHRRAPERVAGLFLVATNARPPTDAQRTAWSAQLHSLAAGASPRDLQEELLPLLVGADPEPDLAARTLALADAVGAPTLRAQLELQSTRVDERPGLAGAMVPCTVVAAAEDRICPLERHTEIHDLMVGSELVVVPGAPHLVALTHPHPVAEAARAWLRRVDG
jgi:pimeloyl-ACP methyl ester carboxylesterase